MLSSIILDFPVILDNQFYSFNIIITETINFKLSVLKCSKNHLLILADKVIKIDTKGIYQFLAYFPS
jgi:hypothetical protein